jgi:hypothetical protein
MRLLNNGGVMANIYSGIALEQVVDTVMRYGQYPEKGRREFDLYDFLDKNLDREELLAFFICSVLETDEDLVERKRNMVEQLLLGHFEKSYTVQELADQLESEDGDEAI